LGWVEAAQANGWLAREQAAALYGAASMVPRGQWIIEIGSHQGRSTIILARAKADGVGLLAVDPFGGERWGGGERSYERFRANLRRAAVNTCVTHYHGTSAEAARGWAGAPVGLLFVDGAHDRLSVLADIDGWERFVPEGGLAVFHDAYSSVGVTLALLQRHLFNSSWQYLGSVRSLAIFRRDASSGVVHLKNVARMVGRLGYFARNLAIKAALRTDRRALLRLLHHHDESFPY
jgi:predicted O-methyltransferase YrrM